MAQSELQMFGDESTSSGFVTYGLVTFADRGHERHARYRWQDVLRAFGGSSRGRIHARTLFSGQARQKTDWARLSEAQASELALRLTRAMKAEGAFFSVGVVDIRSFPAEGIPDGLDHDRHQRFRRWSNPEFFCFAYLAAVHGMRTNLGILRDNMPYRLFLDPLSISVRLFSDWKGIQARELMLQGGLTPSGFDEKPQLLDAADLFAYAAGRAISNEPSRNKQVCSEIFDVTGTIRTDCRWSPTEVAKH